MADHHELANFIWQIADLKTIEFAFETALSDTLVVAIDVAKSPCLLAEQQLESRPTHEN
jgi:hypothetical protein